MRRTWMLPVGLALVVVGLAGCVLVGAVGGPGREVGSRHARSGQPQPGWDGSVPRIVQPATPSSESTGALPAGEVLYLTGIGHVGRVVHTGGPSWFARLPGGCVSCHGADGTSRTVTSASGGSIATGDIRYDTLAGIGVTAESTSTVGGWTDVDIAVAIIKGVEPDGSKLDPTMPLWQLDETDMAALLEHLKELSTR